MCDKRQETKAERRERISVAIMEGSSYFGGRAVDCAKYASYACDQADALIAELDRRAAADEPAKPAHDPDVCTPENRLCKHDRPYCYKRLGRWLCTRKRGHKGKCVACELGNNQSNHNLK